MGKQVYCRVSDEERNTLEKEAAKKGIGLSDLIREKITNEKIEGTAQQETTSWTPSKNIEFQKTKDDEGKEWILCVRGILEVEGLQVYPDVKLQTNGTAICPILNANPKIDLETLGVNHCKYCAFKANYERMLVMEAQARIKLTQSREANQVKLTLTKNRPALTSDRSGVSIRTEGFPRDFNKWRS